LALIEKKTNPKRLNEIKRISYKNSFDK